MRVSEWKEEAGTPRVVLRLGLLLVVPIMAQAERLPINTYTTADGLGSDYILDITRDSRGFLWFSTRDGLSRFDGSRFITYGTGHGLPDPTVNDFLETRHGVCWVATNGGGVCRFNPKLIENQKTKGKEQKAKICDPRSAICSRLRRLGMLELQQ